MAGDSNLWEAIIQGNLAAVAELLEESSDLLQATHESGHGLVRLASDCGHRDLANWLLQRGAPVDAFDAAALGDADRVRLFVEDHPSLLRTTSHDGWTLLHLAGFGGSLELVDWLLEQGSNVAAVSDNEQANSPLHAALAGACDTDCVKALLEAGGDATLQAAHGVAPLHLAASRGDRELVDSLRAAGAVDCKMTNGQTAADMAESRGFAELAQYLRGFDPD